MAIFIIITQDNLIIIMFPHSKQIWGKPVLNIKVRLLYVMIKHDNNKKKKKKKKKKNYCSNNEPLYISHFTSRQKKYYPHALCIHIIYKLYISLYFELLHGCVLACLGAGLSQGRKVEHPHSQGIGWALGQVGTRTCSSQCSV